MNKRLCTLDDLADPGSLAVNMEDSGLPWDLCVVRREGRVSAFINHCPHAGSPLDWVPGEFLSPDKQHIQCSTHHALFEIDTGLCVSGPCVGQALRAVAVEIIDNAVFPKAKTPA